MTLFELEGEYLRLVNLVADSDGEIPPELDEYLDRELATVTENQSEKLEGYYLVIRRLDMEKDAASKEEQRYKKMSKVREKAIDRMVEKIKGYLERTEQDRVTTTTGHTFSIQGNGGKVPLKYADDFDVKKIDPKFMRIKVEPEVDAIREALLGGEEVPGVQLGERGTQLRIK